MRRFLIELQYAGKGFHGWQRLDGRRTVQGVVEDALAKLFGAATAAVGCARTDAGVGARQTFFTCDADTKLPADRVCFKLDRFLPPDVSALASSEVDPTFDLRAAVAKKTYQYAFYVSPHVLPLEGGTAFHVNKPFDPERAQAACRAMIGTHDFAGFSTQGGDARTTVRTVFDAQIAALGGARYAFRICGDGFLYNGVRILAGTAIAVGTGALPPDAVERVFASRDRTLAGPTLPPKALLLHEVVLNR